MDEKNSPLYHLSKVHEYEAQNELNSLQKVEDEWM